MKSYLRSLFCSAGPNGLNATKLDWKFEFHSFHADWQISNGFFNRPFTFNHLLKSWYRIVRSKYKVFGTVLQMDLNRVKFGLWHNVLPKVIFPFAGDNAI